MSDKNVHTEHCCYTHGCKYHNEDCPVENGTQPSSYKCEQCLRDAKYTVNSLTYKNLSDVLKYMGHCGNDDELDAIMNEAFNYVSFGDASFTLVGNNQFVEYLIDYLKLNEDAAKSYRTKYWEFVGDQDYINMED